MKSKSILVQLAIFFFLIGAPVFVSAWTVYQDQYAIVDSSGLVKAANTGVGYDLTLLASDGGYRAGGFLGSQQYWFADEFAISPDASSTLSGTYEFCFSVSGGGGCTHPYLTSSDNWHAVTFTNGQITAIDNGLPTVGQGAIITQITPLTGNTVSTGTPVLFAATGTVDANTYVSGMYVSFRFSNYSVVNSQFTSTALRYAPAEFDVPITSSGTFSVVKYADLSAFDYGEYKLTTQIMTPGILTGSAYASTTFFILGTSSPFDINVASSTQTCNVGLLFNFSLCLTSLLYPQMPDMNDFLTQLQGSVFGVVPWGYALRFYAIIATQPQNAGTSSLPSLIIHFPKFLGIGGGYTVDLTPWSLLLGPGSMLSTATNPDTGHTLKDIMEPNYDYLIYFLFTVYIATRVWGIAEPFARGVNKEARHNYPKKKSKV